MKDLDHLEAEAIYAIREGVLHKKSSILLFSGGKKSIVLFHLIRKAFAPAPFPITLVLLDAIQTFPEVDEFIAQLIKKYQLKLIKTTVSELQKQNAKGSLCLTGECEYEKSLITYPSPETKCLHPEFADLFNHKLYEEENLLLKPLKHWSELDLWEYIKRENIEVPSLYFSHSRLCLRKKSGVLLPMSLTMSKQLGDDLVILNVRLSKIDGIHHGKAMISTAKNSSDVIDEIKGKLDLFEEEEMTRVLKNAKLKVSRVS